MLVFMQDLRSGGWICREKLSISVIIAGFNSLFSRADRIREEGVIGLHALCIISYREEDGATSGNESGRWCSEVNAANANEDAAFAGGHI